MSNVILRVCLFVCLFSIISIAYMGAETVQQKERTYTVKYNDNTVERYKVVWTGNVDIDTHESGGPAKPLEGKFVDDRQCHWTINSTIDRQVFMINKAGQTFGQSSLYKSYHSDFRNQGSDWVVLNFRSENCNDAEARRNSDYSDAKNNIIGVFNGIVDADLPKLKEEIKRDAGVVEVNFP